MDDPTSNGIDLARPVIELSRFFSLPRNLVPSSITVWNPSGESGTRTQEHVTSTMKALKCITLGSKLCVAECYVNKYAKLELVSMISLVSPSNANSSAAGWPSLHKSMLKYNMNGSFVSFLLKVRCTSSLQESSTRLVDSQAMPMMLDRHTDKCALYRI